MLRSAAVAGSFYPADPGSLRRVVQDCLGPSPPHALLPVAILVPHAGYVYSGATAGAVYALVRVPERVVLLGPNHTGRGTPASLWVEGSWRTPLGDVPIDEPFARRLLETVPALEADTRAHDREHALEVQLPFLQESGRGFAIIPLVLADLGLPALLDLGARLAKAIRAAGGETLVVISSDMTHYAPREEARLKDAEAFRPMEKLDAAGLYATVRDSAITMCGVVPATVGLAAAARLGARSLQRVHESCSGDVTGDDSDVVAYAGCLVA